jgi:hypothetical protein
VIGVCARCGRVGQVEHHHITGRSIDGRYLHPGLTVALSIPCHDGLHAVQRAAGIDGDREGTPALVLARIAAWVSWMSEQPGPQGITGELLGELAAALDAPLTALLTIAPLRK